MNFKAAKPVITPATQPKSVSVLGATGSIGRSTIDLIKQAPERYRVVALASKNNVDLLVQQALELRPAFVAIEEEGHYAQLKAGLEGSNIKIGAGAKAVVEAAEMDADWTISAIVGAAALPPTLAAIRRGGMVALANKECLVCAGDLVLEAAKKSGATLLPVDSEHNAIFQSFDFEKPETVEKITLTASGGPFRTTPKEALKAVTAAQAVKHPNWSMGAKISIDSATMMNKGLEIIEAYYLFPLEKNQIDVIVHPESIIHGLVHYTDGSVLAGMSTPDMRVPIAHTLAWPQRITTNTSRLDLTAHGKLTFEAPDEEKFPAIRLAKTALQNGGNAPAILNAANEVCVQHFLDGTIGFLDIAETVEKAIDALANNATLKTVDAVNDIDLKTRIYVNNLIKNLN